MAGAPGYLGDGETHPYRELGSKELFVRPIWSAQLQ